MPRCGPLLCFVRPLPSAPSGASKSPEIDGRIRRAGGTQRWSQTSTGSFRNPCFLRVFALSRHRGWESHFPHHPCPHLWIVRCPPRACCLALFLCGPWRSRRRSWFRRHRLCSSSRWFKSGISYREFFDLRHHRLDAAGSIAVAPRRPIERPHSAELPGVSMDHGRIPSIRSHHPHGVADAFNL
jgi:hypothetical protein